MRRVVVLSLALVSVTISSSAPAYDTRTHFDISTQAAQKSVLVTGSTLDDLGLAAIDDPSQLFPSTAGVNDPGAPECAHAASFTVLNLIACGSRFEDIPGTRVFNHFFDPVHGIPLTTAIGRPGTLLFLPNLTSPDWSLQDPGSLDAGSAQEFAFHNARNYLFNALASPLESDRVTNWGRLFQTIGQVIHHPQDMAQPQHVRNDPHCEHWLCSTLDVLTLGLIGLQNPSRYEAYTARDPDARNAVLGLAAAADGNAIYPGPGNANVAVFDTPRKFFVNAGKGIAEYTNNNFVSAGTNFVFDSDTGTVRRNPNYLLPVPGQAGIPTPVADLFPNGIPDSVQFGCGVSTDNCVMTFFTTLVSDPLTGVPSANSRASTLSIFDQDLQAPINIVDPVTGLNYATTKQFALNHFNFDAAHQFLIPRAVSYSAGLINYFFRGKIDLIPDVTQPGTYLIQNLGSEPMDGTFFLYYDSDDSGTGTVNNRTLVQQPWVNVQIAAGGQVNVGAIAAPATPTPKMPGAYMLVFQGTMGAETGAVVGKAVKPQILIFATDSEDPPGDGTPNHTTHMFIQQTIAQRLLSNPGGITAVVAGVALPPMQISNISSCGFFSADCVLTSLSAGVLLSTDPFEFRSAHFTLTTNNAFTVGGLFSGSTPADLQLIPLDTLCANFIESTSFEVAGFPAFSPVQVSVFFEGQLLFQYVASHAVLTNVSGVGLTDVTCRVSIQ